MSRMIRILAAVYRHLYEYIASEFCQERKVRGQGQGIVVRRQRQGQGLVNWSSMILEDKDFPRREYSTLHIAAAVSLHNR